MNKKIINIYIGFSILILCIYMWYKNYNTKVINILGNGKIIEKF